MELRNISYQDTGRMKLERWFDSLQKQISSPPPNSERPNRLWEPPNSRSVGAGVLPPGIRRPRREADHSPPSRTESKKKRNFAASFHGVHSLAIYELSPPRAASVGCSRLPAFSVHSNLTPLVAHLPRTGYDILSR